MHRVTYFPTEEPSENLALVEQPEAAVLFLTSVTSDIATLSHVLQGSQKHGLNNNIRALQLSQLKNNAFIDHYLDTTAKNSKIIIIRFLGSRSDWSYGFEQFYNWSKIKSGRTLIILSGTDEQIIELNSLSNINYESSILLGQLLTIGGYENVKTFLDITYRLLIEGELDIRISVVKEISDPYKWLWNEDNKDKKVGVIFYRSILNSGDHLYAKEIVDKIRASGLCPRAIWVSSLKNIQVQKKILKLFTQENIKCIATTTSFASVDFEEANYGKQIWDKLDVPIFQILTSIKSKKLWLDSSRGLDPIDLSLQVALPEIDGRITTKIGAFKTLDQENINLATPIYKLLPEKRSIDWIIELMHSWIKLQFKPKEETKIVIFLSNYPVKDGRIGNGVGLDTPESLFLIIAHLGSAGYTLEDISNITSNKDLMRLIINGRTNSTESETNSPLTYLPLKEYNKFWESISSESRESILSKWGEPKLAFDLKQNGFPINGIKLGNIVILLQPTRGYTEDNIKDIHSPVLPPHHNYIAHYLWVKSYFKADLIIHLGKHGTVEWLPGKGIGQSESCFPQLLVPNIPHLYPFIVNDPGEGSQAKRRSHAVILDHLTPPLGRATLSPELIELEVLLDEYYESISFNSSRTNTIKLKLDEIINNLQLDKVITLESNRYSCEDIYNNLDSYLCELKESQIRTGLHVYGKLPPIDKLEELALSIALSPSFSRLGITQLLTKRLGLDLDPWNDREGDLITKPDKEIIKRITKRELRTKGDYITWINDQALIIVRYHTRSILGYKESDIETNKIMPILSNYISSNEYPPYIKILRKDIIKPLIESPKRELLSFEKGLQGKRVPSGPSGAPSRGNLNVIPTGKNFYSVDLRGLPTEAAWDLGRRSAEKILELYLLENGSHLNNIAMSVWATSTMRNGGEDISQLLALIGVQPIWDRNTRKLLDIEVTPLTILNRPRVDVTLRISGLFRDAFPNLIDLVNKAIKLVGSLNESKEQNPYAASINNGEAMGRVYGSAPEGYGTGLQELINLSSWEKQEDLADCYLKSSKWLYKDSNEPCQDINGLKSSLKKAQVVIHSQDNREHDILDSDDYYQFHGGLFSAVKSLSEEQPSIYFADNSRHSSPKIHNLYKEIDKVVRSRLLNQKWINGMKDHGYKGAFEISASFDYLFAYDASTDSVPEWCYSSILEKWLEDPLTYRFLLEENPWALRDISERFLEAFNRGMWNASEKELDIVKDIIIKSERNIEELNY